MTPLALFLLGCATVFLAPIQAAFSALMRLSLRLMAERGGRSDRLGRYLDDPLQLFIPVRILIGICTVLAGALIARLSDVHDVRSVAIFIVSLVAFVIVCEHLLPMLVVRLGAEEVLDVAAAGVSADREADAAADADAHPDQQRPRRARGAGANGAAEPSAITPATVRSGRRRRRDLGGGGPRAAAVDRRFHRDGRPRGHDAASRHRGDSRRRHACRSCASCSARSSTPASRSIATTSTTSSASST